MAVPLLELRLVLPEVDVRRGAGAENLQDALRLGRVLRDAGDVGSDVAGKQVGQRQPGDAGDDVPEQAAAGERLSCLHVNTVRSGTIRGATEARSHGGQVHVPRSFSRQPASRGVSRTGQWADE